MDKPIQLGDVQCPPGELRLGRLVCGYLEDSSPVSIPLIVTNGTENGPVLWLGSTVHGVEIAGIEVIRRVTREEVNPRTLRGAILAAPIMNPLAYLAHSPYALKDGLNMNRVYPGDPDETISHRMAYEVFSQGIAQADYVMDFHATPGAIDTIFVRAGQDEVQRKSMEMAEAYGITIVESIRKQMGYGFQEQITGLLVDAAAQAGKPSITVELTPQYVLEETSIRSGVTGTLNVMKYFGLIEGQIVPQVTIPVIKQRLGPQLRVTAKQGGLVHYLVPVGSWVTSGQDLIHIRDPWGDIVETVKSPAEAYLLGYPHHGNQAVTSGDLVAFLAPPR